MREVVIDIRSIAEKYQNGEGRPFQAHSVKYTNEEDWLLWTYWNKVSHVQLEKDMKHDRITLKRRYDFLESQGGPSGEKPEWVPVEPHKLSGVDELYESHR